MNMYTLYGRPATGSAAVEALLEELGLPYRLETVAKGPDGRPSAHYLANINPLGPVPALKLPDGSVMTESAAMMIYLADLVPGANLAPLPTHPARGQYLRVMLFLAAEIYPADLRLFYSDRYRTAYLTIWPICSATSRFCLAKNFPRSIFTRPWWQAGPKACPCCSPVTPISPNTMPA